jgi:hypothetical protein
MAPHKVNSLTQDQIDHFMEHGWLHLTDCFNEDDAAIVTENIWTRLGLSPTDKSTWTQERINMPWHREFDVSKFSPKAWNAICDLLGGEDKIAEENKTWKDSAIVNFGTPEGAGKDVDPRDLQGWHVDGDFFVHYLDSPEQGLLVIPLFTNIRNGGGGTMICPEAIQHVAKHLYDHPEGVSPRMTPRAENPSFEQEKTGLTWFNNLAKRCNEFEEASGKIGDVYLLHPLMLHSASNNKLRELRIITNPPVSIKEPFNFDRENPEEYSIVERTTLKKLGKERLEGWKIQGERQRVVPERVRIQQRMKEEELKRLGKAGEKVETQPVQQTGVTA